LKTRGTSHRSTPSDPSPRLAPEHREDRLTWTNRAVFLAVGSTIHALMLSVLLTRADWAQLAARVGLLPWVFASFVGAMVWGGS